MVITRQVWMAAAVAGSAGCLALAPVCLALGKADAPVEITFKTILGMKMAIRDEKEIQLNEAGFAVQKFFVHKTKLTQHEPPLAAVHALQPSSLPHANDQIWNVSDSEDPRLHMSELVSGECTL